MSGSLLSSNCSNTSHRIVNDLFLVVLRNDKRAPDLIGYFGPVNHLNILILRLPAHHRTRHLARIRQNIQCETVVVMIPFAFIQRAWILIVRFTNSTSCMMNALQQISNVLLEPTSSLISLSCSYASEPVVT